MTSKKWFVDKEHKIIKYFMGYTILFFILLFFVFSSFIKNNKSFVWNIDGIRQHYPIMVYIYSYFKEIIKNIIINGDFSIRMVDFNIGMGMDILTTLNYYGLGDPLYLLTIFFKPNQMEFAYNFLIILRLYLAGISFSVYCIYMRKESLNILIGSFVYIFCGFSMFASVRHPFFITPMIYLPLLLIGIEQILKLKKSCLFVFIIFLSAISNYYFFYMMTILIFIYAFIRFFDIYKYNRLKNFITIFFKGIFLYILGIGMAMFIFLPILLAFLNNARINNSGIDIELFKYSKEFYIKFLAYFISSPKIFGQWNIEGYIPLSLICIISLFNKKKKQFSLKLGFIILTIFMLIPFFGYMFNGFSYITNRWIFAYGLLISYIVVTILPDLYKINKDQILIIFSGIILYSIWCICNNVTRDLYSLIGIIMLLFTFIILLLINNNYIDSKKIKPEIFILCVSIISIIINATFLYSNKIGNYSDQFINSRELDKYILNSPINSISKIDDTNFYRIGVYEDNNVNASLNGNNNINASLIQRYNSISAYYSLIDSIYLDYFMNLECIGNSPITVCRSFNNRIFLDTLSSIKYYVTEKSKKQKPLYGYKKVLEYKREISDKDISDEVYENTYSLPLGYTYKGYITEDEFNNLNSLQKQESMLQAIVLSDNDKLNSDLGGGYYKDNPTFTFKSIPFKISKLNNVKYKDNILEVTKNNGSIELEFDGLLNSETYVRLNNFDLNSEISDLYINAKTDSYNTSAIALSNKSIYYFGRKNYLINLGYQQDSQTKCTISFSKKGKFKLDNIEVYCQPMDKYPEQIEDLKEDIMENIKLSINKITGNVDLKEDKFLCLSIPYSEGWSAKVNGQKIDLLKANIMYMAIPLKAGNNEIELNYVTPGIRLGLIISSISWIIFILNLIYQFKFGVKKEGLI